TFQSLASASALIFLSCVSTVQRSPLRSMEARTYAATSFVFLSATRSTMQPSLRERVLQPRYVLRDLHVARRMAREDAPLRSAGPGRRGGPADGLPHPSSRCATPAVRATSRQVAAREAMLAWALSPLGCGTTHSGTSAGHPVTSAGSWSPSAAFGSA